MKTPIFIALAAALTGCTSHATVAPAAGTAQTIGNPADAYDAYQGPGYVTPGKYKVYYVGPAIDPAHPQFMSTGGDMVVREKSEGWRLANTPGRDSTTRFTFGPDESMMSPAFHPEPTPAEYDMQMARALKVMAAMSEKAARLERANIALRAEASAPKLVDGAVNASNSTIDTAAGGSSETTTVKGSSATPELVTLLPNADGVIAMDLAFAEQPGVGELNPFAVRFNTKLNTRKVELKITSLAIGPRASVTLNRKMLSIGETYEGFILYSIDPDGIFLRKDGFLLRIPVSDKAIQVRVP